MLALFGKGLLCLLSHLHLCFFFFVTIRSTERLHMSEVEEPGVRGKPQVKWENRVEEYMRERGSGGLNQTKRESWHREKWRIFCHGHPLWVSSCREQGIRVVDRLSSLSGPAHFFSTLHSLLTGRYSNCIYICG